MALCRHRLFLVFIVLSSTLFFSFFYHHQPRQTTRILHLLLPIDARAAAEGPNFCKSLLSALVHGYDPIIINWDVHGDVEFMQRMKVLGVHQFLSNLTHKSAQSDLVFMMDALDVWLQLSPQSLISRFEELRAPGVVLGADKSCWPNEWESRACQDVPESTLPKGAYGPDAGPEVMRMRHTRPRWANSGTVIGTVADMHVLYKDLVSAFRDPSRQIGSDQAIFNEFLSRRLLTLDYRSRLFWGTAYASPLTTSHFINTPFQLDPYVPHHLYPPMLWQAQTGQVPVAVHFTGKIHKVLMREWWGRFWWNQVGEGGRFREVVLRRLDGASVRFGGVRGARKKWRDICPNETLAL